MHRGAPIWAGALRVLVSSVSESTPSEPAVWGRWMAQHQHSVVLALLARGVRLSQARALAHEAFATLFVKWIDGRLPFVELPGLAIAEANFLLQRGGRARETVPADAPEVLRLEDPGQTPEDVLANRERLARLTDAFERLSPRAQEVFLACYEDPATPHREIAERLELSVQRVRQTLCEVRARLRASIADQVAPAVETEVEP